MRRDMDVIRRIMLAAEEGNRNERPEDIDEEVFRYHQAQAIEYGLLKGSIIYPSDGDTDVPANVFVSRITPAGHDFLDGIREEQRWARVKDYIQKTGMIASVESVKVVVHRLFMELQ